MAAPPPGVPAPLLPARAPPPGPFAGRASAAAGAQAAPGGLPRERAIVHLDMDSFFAAAAAVGRPEFAGLPLAVCHSSSERGSGEVSSANYEARAYGGRRAGAVGGGRGRPRGAGQILCMAIAPRHPHPVHGWLLRGGPGMCARSGLR